VSGTGADAERRAVRLALAAALALGGLLGAAGAGAHEAPEPMNRISFSVERETQVDNDRMTAVLAVTDEDDDTAELADRVNRAMRQGLDAAHGVAAVTAHSGSYQTYPVYDEQRIQRWRARQELVLESSDFEALTALIGRLQGGLELASVGFTVSPERRREAEEALTSQALAAFQQRAGLVARSLGASGHALVALSVRSDGGTPPQPLYERSAGVRTAAAQMEVAPPALEAGRSRVVVSVDGTVELRFPAATAGPGGR